MYSPKKQSPMTAARDGQHLLHAIGDVPGMAAE
jgi:hypothetical protein